MLPLDDEEEAGSASNGDEGDIALALEEATPADRLEAVLSLLLGAEGEGQLAQAKELARRIVVADGEGGGEGEEEGEGGEGRREQQQQPRRHARNLKAAVRHLRRRGRDDLAWELLMAAAAAAAAARGRVESDGATDDDDGGGGDGRGG